MVNQKQTRHCPKCGLSSSHPTECAHCGIIFERFSIKSLDQEIEPIREEKNYDEVFENYKINLYSLPVGLLAAFLIQQFSLFKILSTTVLSMSIHEFGHAVTAWMMGQFAIPIPMAGLTLPIGSRSTLVSLLFISAFSYLAYKSWKEKIYFLFSLSVGFILASLYLLKNYTNSTQMPVIFFAGVAGEFILSAILILAFYNPLFKKIRWDFFRYFFFAVGCMVYVESSLLWINISLKRSAIPFGSCQSADGAGAKEGDMNRLIADGWTENDITSRYLMVLKITLILIILQYAYRVLIKSRRA